VAFRCNVCVCQFLYERVLFFQLFFFIYGYLISVYYYSPDRFERFRNKISVGNLRKTRKKRRKRGKTWQLAAAASGEILRRKTMKTLWRKMPHNLFI